MSETSQATIDGLKKQLQERLSALFEAMDGRAMEDDRKPGGGTLKGYRWVTPSAIRLATDDFNTLLKEVKRQLSR